MTAACYQTLLRCGAQQLSTTGVLEPAREVRLLMQWAAEISATELIAEETNTPSLDALSRWQEGLARRLNREPLAHITGQVDFYDLTIKTDSRALVPRSDSECVVGLAISRCAVAPTKIADLGTGSGCLLLALLSYFEDAQGMGLDHSADALALAAENARETALATRTRFVRDSWEDWTCWGEFDLIISNPPYVDQNALKTLEPEVRVFDPLSALDGGADGLEAYRAIIAGAANGMRPGAQLVLEIGYDQKEAVAALLKANDFSDISSCHDLAEHDRGLAAKKR